MALLENSLFFVAKFFEGFRKLGFFNSLKIFFLAKYKYGLFKIYLKDHTHPIFIRGKTSDADVFRIIFIHNEYPYLKNLNPKIIIDAGSNAGYSVLKFYISYPSVTIFAIEPEPSNYEILKKNVGNLNKVQLYNKALWTTRENHLVIGNSRSNVSFSLFIGDPLTGKFIKGITIQDIINDNGIDEIDILKIDIEGAEKMIFDNPSIEWLQRVKVIFIELHDNKVKGCGNAFFKSVIDKGFLFFVSGENVILIRENLNIVI